MWLTQNSTKQAYLYFSVGTLMFAFVYSSFSGWPQATDQASEFNEAEAQRSKNTALSSTLFPTVSTDICANIWLTWKDNTSLAWYPKKILACLELQKST